MKFVVKPLALFLLMLTTLLPASSFAGFWSVKPSMANVPYGRHAKQTMDVYLPSEAKNAPVIFMVHGGAWKTGDKSARSVVHNKVKRWVKKGFIFVSINNRLMPEAKPLEQADDVRVALAYAQKHALEWGGDGSQFIVMGHSAGAHLVSLVSTTPALAAKQGIKPWLATIAIDSAAFDVEAIMLGGKPKRFFKQAFGEKPSYWERASPISQLKEKTVPFLAVCTIKRKDGACDQARQFIQKAKAHGSVAQVLPVDLSHRKANSELGKNNTYTKTVERFMKTLNLRIAQ